MLTVHLAPTSDLPAVRYRWDADTDILSAECDAPADAPADASAGAPVGESGGSTPRAAVREPALVVPPPGAARVGTIEVEGADGSWLSLDVVRGCIAGVQVAVWPTVRRRAALLAPPAAPCRAFALGGRAGDDPVALEVSGSVVAETDAHERTFHFRFGPPRAAERARIARDVVLEIDARRRLAGLWLTNVPPCPNAPTPDAPDPP